MKVPITISNYESSYGDKPKTNSKPRNRTFKSNRDDIFYIEDGDKQMLPTLTSKFSQKLEGGTLNQDFSSIIQSQGVGTGPKNRSVSYSLVSSPKSKYFSMRLGSLKSKLANSTMKKKNLNLTQSMLTLSFQLL